MFIKFRSIRTRVFFSTVFVIILVTVFIGMINKSYYRNLLINELRVKMSDIVRIISFNISASLEFNDYAASMESLQSLKEMQELNAVTIYDSNNEVFATFARSESQEAVPLELMEEAEQAVAKPAPPTPSGSEDEPSTGAANQFTVGSLINE